MAIHIERPGVVVPVRLDPTGAAGPTPGQARGPGWRRVGCGLYVPASVDPGDPEQRIVEAVLGTSHPVAATGWAALRWQRARWFGGLATDGVTPLPVPLALGDRRAVRPRAGVVICEDWLFADDVVELDGLSLTVAERSVAYEVLRAGSLIGGVRAIDMAAADDLVDVASMHAYVLRLAGRPGVRRLRAAIDWADENSWSPQEPTMRIHWRRHRPQARLLCNAPVFDLDGRHLLTPDLLDVEHGVAGEYDGVVHLGDGPRRRDLDRDAQYRDLGIELVTMMSGDGGDLTAFLARLQGAYRRGAPRRGAGGGGGGGPPGGGGGPGPGGGPRARAAPPRPGGRGATPRPGPGRGTSRSWTMDQPDWWVDTSTVARRRALDADQRTVWLRRLAS